WQSLRRVVTISLGVGGVPRIDRRKQILAAEITPPPLVGPGPGRTGCPMGSLPCGRSSAPEAKAVLGGGVKGQLSVRERAMTGTRSWVTIMVLEMISIAFWSGQPATAQEAPLVPQITYEVQRDVSAPLRDTVMATGPSAASSVVIPKRHPRRIRPPE